MSDSLCLSTYRVLEILHPKNLIPMVHSKNSRINISKKKCLQVQDFPIIPKNCNCLKNSDAYPFILRKRIPCATDYILHTWLKIFFTQVCFKIFKVI